jgi:hypothetical protein
MSHKNFLMWVFSTLDLGKTREFHECVLGFNGRRRGLTRRSHAGAGASSTRESGSKTACPHPRGRKRGGVAGAC